ncbi:MAG: carotenoid biosynthesis protein [bacterium]|nr:carotenoid biosynthesis protein [bacterium]
MTKEPDPQFEKRLLWGLLGFFLVAIGVNTYLHYIAPGILRVPQETDLPRFLWPFPPLEEPGTYFLGFLCGYHCLHRRGLWQLMLFLSGSFLITGIQENIWILSGRFGLTPPTYYFSNMGILWFLEIPVSVCVGWFVFAYSCVYISEVVFGPQKRLLNAFVGAFLAMNIDLYMDPLASHHLNHSWTWLMENTFLIFSIPLTNFLGWFGLIFIFALLWEKTGDWAKEIGYRRATLRFFLLIPILDIFLFALLYLSWIFIINPLLGGINLTIGGI